MRRGVLPLNGEVVTIVSHDYVLFPETTNRYCGTIKYDGSIVELVNGYRFQHGMKHDTGKSFYFEVDEIICGKYIVLNMNHDLDALCTL